MENTFMQDGASCHTSKSTIEYLERNHIIYLSDWPSQSPDLNLIENLWNTLKMKVKNQKPTSIDMLWDMCQMEWSKISTAEITNLYNSIRKSLLVVLICKGLNSKY